MAHPLHQIRLRDLLLLEHVQSLGTLGQAAQALQVTQPAVTQMLKGLEQSFGLPLVQRGRRGVNLTAAGQAALARLRCAREEIEAAHAAAQSAHQPVLRVGATPIASLRLLPQALARMQQVQTVPQLPRIELSEAGVDALWRQLAEGRLDALVGRLPGSGAGRFEGLRHAVIGSERMVLAGRASHPLARAGGAVRTRHQWLQALADSDWVLPPADALAVLAFNEWFAAAGLLAPQPRIVSGSFYAALNLVARADLLAVVPESAVLGLQATLGLAVLRTPWRNPPVDIVFAARASNWDSEGVTALRECFLPAPQPARRRRGA